MKKISYLVLFLFLASCGSDKTASLSNGGTPEITPLISRVTVQSILSNMGKGKYREGELLVKFRDGVTATSSLKTHQAFGAASHRRYTLVPNLDHVRLQDGLSVRDAAIRYMNDPNVEYAEPNYIRRISATPNDPLFSQQWALTKISAPQAWDIVTGSSTVIIAVLDTGIDLNHPDLVANIIPGFNFVANNSVLMDDNGHGTHVSGIAGAAGNNGTGIAGVIWNVKLMPVKFLDANGEGDIAGEISAIDFAVAHGAKIMNASFSGADFSQSEFAAVSSANNAGVLLMAAAGNDGPDNAQTPNYPASYSNPGDPNIIRLHLAALPNILSVTATDQSDTLASFSNFGLNSVHIAAPGDGILSTYLPSTYASLSGTSMSTPFVSGLAGLLYSYYTNFTYSQIRGTILRYVDVLPLLNGKIMTGGRINAYKALSSLLTPTGLTASATSASQIGLTWTDNATGEDGYKVEKKIGGGAFNQIATVAANATAFTDSSATDGAISTYRVRAFNLLPNPPGSAQIEADSSYSSEASVTTSLNPPSGLTAAAVSTTQVTLTWTDNSQAEEGYKIERKALGGDFVEISTVGPNTATYSDTGRADGTTYTYRVRGFSTAAGNSQYSNESSATTALNPPTGLTATNVTSTSVTLVWTDNSQSEQGHRIEEGAPGGSFVQIAEIGANSTSFTVSGLNSSTSYSFRVRAFNTAAGNSQYSNESSVTTPSSGGGGTSSSSGGGGGCSVGARQNTPTTMVDFAVLLMPLLIFALWRRRV